MKIGDGSLLKYQIPEILFEAALHPIGRLPVQLGGLEIAKTGVDQFGATSFHLPAEIYDKVINREYVVRNLLYHADEGNGGNRKDVKIVCLTIVRAPRSEH